MQFDPAGDFFGDYKDLSNTQEPLSPESYKSDSDTDMEELIAESASGWEPQRPVQHTLATENQPAELPRTAEPSSIHLPPPETFNPPPSGYKPPFVERYPHASAGAPHFLAIDRGNDHEEYAKKIGTSNPWAPFESEIDWKLAKWAKMRGPSSTALTELLDIPGVRLLLYFV